MTKITEKYKEDVLDKAFKLNTIYEKSTETYGIVLSFKEEQYLYGYKEYSDKDLKALQYLDDLNDVFLHNYILKENKKIFLYNFTKSETGRNISFVIV